MAANRPIGPIRETAVDDEVGLVLEGDDLAVVGDATAVEGFLRRHGLWEGSIELDLTRLRGITASGAEAMGTASEIVANSSRYVKLTKESARLVEEFGLMQSKAPGESHLMIGIPGQVASWLQAEAGPASLLTNPAFLSGLAGLMSQVTSKHAMAEILDYLATIDEKVDDLRRKIDNTMVSGFAGMAAALDRAMVIREEVGSVDDDTWSTIDQAPATIGLTMEYALGELDAIASELESTKLREVVQTVDIAETEVQKWLAVLAYCLEMQERFDILQLDRKSSESLEQLSNLRRGMTAFREERRDRLAACTTQLLTRMDVAVGKANGKLVWTRTKSVAVVAAGNHVANDVHRFEALLGIDTVLRSWEVEQLGRVADVGSRTIQKTKDTTPYIAGLITIGTITYAAAKKLSDDK
jgi:hypothetical protein